MLNNKTFKSLAVATVLAFGATSISGPAAFAAQTFKLQSAVGTTTNFNTLNDSYNGVTVDSLTKNLSAGFSLKVFVSNEDNDPYLNLKGADEAEFAYVIADAASGSATDIEAAVDLIRDDLDDSDLDGDGAIDAADIVDLGSDGEADIELRAETGWQVVTVFAVNTNGADDIESTDVTATVYGEADATLGMTAGDDNVGPSAKINFYAPADVKITAAFDDVNFGDETVNASVTTSPELNLNQVYWNAYSSIDGLVNSRTFNVDGTLVAELGLDLDDDKIAFLTGDVDADWAAVNGGDEVITEATYKVQAFIYDGEDHTDSSSAAKYLKITEPEADDITLDVVSDGNVYDSDPFLVRSGIKTVSIEGVVEDDSNDPVAGAVVTIAIGTTDMEDGETIKAGGKTYTVDDDAEDIEVEVKTNADGEYALSVTTSTAVDGESFWVGVSTPGDLASTTEAESWVEWEDAVYDDFYTTPSGGVLGVTASGTVALNFLVVDQFGEPISKDENGDSYRVYVEDGSSVEEEIAQTVTVSGGKATVSFKNLETAGSSYDLDAYLFVEGTNKIEDSIDESTTTVYVWEAASTTVALEDDGEYTDGEVTYFDYVTGTDVPADSVDSSDLEASNTEITITGFVEDANGNVQPGAPVTIAGKGYLFADVYDEVWATDSITVYADENGEFEADVYSHVVADEAKITVTSGSGSETALVTFDLPTSIDAADVTWTVSGPSYSQSGKTAVVVATLADKWGNGLSGQRVDVTLDGIGLLNGDDQIERTTNASGQVKAYLSVNTGDLGTSELTFTLDSADEEYFDIAEAEAEDVLNPELTKSTTWGVTYAKASAGNNVNVSFGYAKGKRVKIYVDGVLKFNVLKKSDTPVKKSYKAAAGSHRVVVKVDGVTIKSRTVTAK